MLCLAQLAPKTPKLPPDAVLRHVSAAAGEGGAGWPADLLQVLRPGHSLLVKSGSPSNLYMCYALASPCSLLLLFFSCDDMMHSGRAQHITHTR